jgi:hypothetical protein
MCALQRAASGLQGFSRRWRRLQEGESFKYPPCFDHRMNVNKLALIGAGLYALSRLSASRGPALPPDFIIPPGFIRQPEIIGGIMPTPVLPPPGGWESIVQEETANWQRHLYLGYIQRNNFPWQPDYNMTFAEWIQYRKRIGIRDPGVP